MSTTPAPLYKIANWHALYESRESHRTAGPMKWLPVVTKTDGFGFGLLRQQKNNTELLAAWYLLLGIAAKQDKHLRGYIARDGVALTADDLGLMTGFPVKIFEAAFAFFSQPKQGWLVVEACADLRENRASCADSAQAARYSCEKAPTVEDRILQDRIGQDKTAEQIAAGAATAGAVPVLAETPTTKPAATTPPTDADWLDGLKRNPAYEGIDVLREHAKAAVWCENKRRTLSRARFINWLNRAERPMAGRSTMR